MKKRKKIINIVLFFLIFYIKNLEFEDKINAYIEENKNNIKIYEEKKKIINIVLFFLFQHLLHH